MPIKTKAAGLVTQAANQNIQSYDKSIQQFSDAIRASGIIPPDTIQTDGKLHRFSSNGRRNDDAGWYVLHGDGIPAGSFGDWRTGVSQSWRADIGRNLTEAEIQANRERMDTMRRQHEAEEAERKKAAREKSHLIWTESYPCANHDYLTRKGIAAHGAKVIIADTARKIAPYLSEELTGELLVIPMRDTDEVIHSLQFITAGGTKRPVTGGRKQGCYFSIGKPDGLLCIAEGFATGVSIRKATGYAVAVAFDAGNLLAVAKALHEKFPDLLMVMCADDDYCTEGNPGLTRAREAAQAVGGLLAIPDFGPNRPEGATDFNDLHQHYGVEAVHRVISGLVSPADMLSDDISQLLLVRGVTGVQANNDGRSTVTPMILNEVTEVTNTIPGADDRPAFRVFDDWQEHDGAMYRPGVWYFGIKQNKAEVPPILTQSWVCSPLYVEAVTFDGQQNNFGRLLRFKNTLNRWCEWAMPMELLRGAGDDLRGELLSMGVEIDPAAKNLLANYLQAKPPKRRMRCALQVGWCDDSFVLPDVVIGPRSSGVIFQTGERNHDVHTQAGTLTGWKSEIAARAVGNPLLVLALSASFAGPLLAPCNMEGGGIHFVGDSSTGKTTAIEAACATWGGVNFKRSWRATANGMEGAAALFNDCILALDEISECDPREVGAIVYALGNGRGKQRASRSGNARGVTRWRCFVVSSGERTISTTMAEGGHRAKAGQTVRLLDIPAARTYGAWDMLHGSTSGTAFSDAIKRAATIHHGHAGRSFLEKLTREERDLCGYLETIKGLPAFQAEGSEGQDRRAAGRFALLALAGELATEYGITGWPEGEAIQAASEGFKVWRAMRGKGNDERRQILERVSGFIDRYGDGRFSNADEISGIRIPDRAGFWRDGAEGREYLFTAEGMREALKGFDFNRALDILEEAGALAAPGTDGKRARAIRISGRLIRLYHVQYEKLGGDHGA